MATFRETLLTDVSELCKSLFEHRLTVVRSQQLVSEKAKNDILVLIVRLDELRKLTPFPAEADVDTNGLASLKTAIAAADAPQVAIQENLMTWATGVTGDITARAADSRSPSDLNQRMLDNLDVLRSTIDNRRLDLFGQYDKEAYVEARNAYTLTRTIYAERLSLNQIDATGEDNKKMEDEIITAVAGATGANFPATIQASANFMEERLFPAV